MCMFLKAQGPHRAIFPGDGKAQDQICICIQSLFLSFEEDESFEVSLVSDLGGDFSGSFFTGVDLVEGFVWDFSFRT